MEQDCRKVLIRRNGHLPVMDANVQSFLYRDPLFYELAYPEPDDDTPIMCRRMFSRYLWHRSSSHRLLSKKTLSDFVQQRGYIHG
jgi:hypothetical protein